MALSRQPRSRCESGRLVVGWHTSPGSSYFVRWQQKGRCELFTPTLYVISGGDARGNPETGRTCPRQEVTKLVEESEDTGFHIPAGTNGD
jgi:hypothetical protein